MSMRNRQAIDSWTLPREPVLLRLVVKI